MTKIFEDLKGGLAEVDQFLAGERNGYKVTVPTEIDVKSIRRELHMTQAKFSDAFGFSLDAVKHWEGGRRTPEASARAFLTVIAKNPQAVIAALHSKKRGPAARDHTVKSADSPTRKKLTKRRIPQFVS